MRIARTAPSGDIPSPAAAAPVPCPAASAAGAPPAATCESIWMSSSDRRHSASEAASEASLEEAGPGRPCVGVWDREEAALFEEHSPCATFRAVRSSLRDKTRCAYRDQWEGCKGQEYGRRGGFHPAIAASATLRATGAIHAAASTGKEHSY